MPDPPLPENPAGQPPSPRKSLIRRRRVRDLRPPAQSPGSLVHVGERHEENVHFHIIDYGPVEANELRTHSIQKCLDFEVFDSPTWIRVIGLHDIEKIASLLEKRGVHPLIQEDVLNTNQRPKVEMVGDTLFAVIKVLVPAAPPEHGVHVENLSILLSTHLVITFHESDSDLYDPVLKRIRDGKGRVRNSGSDYLFWAILDTVVDHYFIVLAQIEDQIERLDTLLMENDQDFDPRDLHALKQDIFQLYRFIRPVRELVAGLGKLDSTLISSPTQIFLRDLYDHAIHAIEITENLRESVNGLRDYHANAVSLRMNEIMKVLTSFATIFLPLTFLAGVYGMNFSHMPELSWRWAYPVLWGFFLLVALVMFIFFRRRKWL